MALKNGLTPVGLDEINDVYINIKSIYMKKRVRICTIVMTGYATEEKFTSGEKPLTDFKNMIYTISGDDYDNYLDDSVLLLNNKSVESQVYNYLKTLPEFSTFSDV